MCSSGSKCGNKYGPDGVDDAEAQRPRQRVLALLRDILDDGGLFQRALRLGDDALAHGRERDLRHAALEQHHPQLLFQLADRHAQRGLADEAGLRGAAKMTLTRHRHDVTQSGEGHCQPNRPPRTNRSRQ